jgi:hypothetical protein
MSGATAKQRMLLTSGAFVGGHVFMALNHGGAVGAIVATAVAYGAWQFADEVFEKINQDDGDTTPRLLNGKKRGLAYRLLTSKANRVSYEPTDEELAEHIQRHSLDEENDFDVPYLTSGTFIFSLLLATGWHPSAQQIFLARLDDGTDVFVSLKQIVHIALAGATRQGKTSIIRQLLAQLCYIGCHCLLLDPHYTPYDLESNEDWTPFTKHLRADPMECRSYDRIEQLLKYTATTFLEKRRELRAQTKPVGKHTFIFIDEYPAIIAEKPKVQGYVAKLLREGGKYNIHLVVASQDFQVKTVSPQAGGAIREHYNVCLYVGGDPTTAKVLLNTVIDGSEESQLGKGSIYLRCPTCKDAAPGHTPWMDNTAVYELAGVSLLSDEEIDEIQDAADDETATLNLNGQTEENSRIADRGSRTAEAQNELKTEDSESVRDPRIAEVPTGWTTDEVEKAIWVYKNLRHRDDTLKAVGKVQNKDNRTALGMILKQAGLVKGDE